MGVPASQTLSVLSQEPVKKRQWRLTSGRTRDKELTKLQLIVDSTRQKPAFLGVRVGQLVRVGVHPHALRLRVEIDFSLDLRSGSTRFLRSGSIPPPLLVDANALSVDSTLTTAPVPETETAAHATHRSTPLHASADASTRQLWRGEAQQLSGKSTGGWWAQDMEVKAAMPLRGGVRAARSGSCRYPPG